MAAPLGTITQLENGGISLEALPYYKLKATLFQLLAQEQEINKLLHAIHARRRSLFLHHGLDPELEYSFHDEGHKIVKVESAGKTE